MNWAWAGSLDQFWHSPNFPVWLALGAAFFFGLVALIALLRAEKSVASGALAVIALLAIAVAAASTIRGVETGQGVPAQSAVLAAPAMASLPALACLDELAGDVVLAACEKALFGSAEAAAAAVSATAAKIGWLTAHGDLAAADKARTPDLMASRRALERDRYGLVAYVLEVRDHCQPGDCATYASLTNHDQIAANMAERTYENLVTRYAATWNAPPPASGATLAGLPPSLPTGRPTTTDFPSAASIPPVNIMTPEPVAPSRPAPAANAPAATPRPAVAATAPATSAAAKKQAVPKASRPQAGAPAGPVQLAPEAADPDN